ncbi:PREDICTED: ABSCISIC ACID-INSENSITIVE 5-like protein 5 [Lupinus angustifolius]|uniref:ABSCISIC ACID-INSENSITIVE 5-like protein 5 n=1 Tax=Lupinus angustifolius TaxID=3871 RepID=UPI00092E2673|nr:PREDICTED: ABSCISIC ACID-INSENSITIVE 5-like protein 5 [Lupinus angustifolius]XP_019417060.1 PREDICTED: ABSCISIC ACID-INSENSITIVE 5-like protein 5 [Lupinus angustifolius]
MNFKGFGNDPGGSDNGAGGRPPAPGNYLSRQSSVYSLTFDEFMTTMGGSGKDFGSMNMDELLKNIWTAEEVQTTGSATAIQSGTGTLGGVGVAHLQKQGSLTLPRTLSQKTVDDVWKDISKDYGGSSGSAVPNLAQPEKQPTLGEMTLEEFLVRAGVVREDAQQFNAKQNDSVFGGLGMGMGYHQQLNKVNGLTSNNTNRIGGGGGVNNNDPNSMVARLQSPSTNLPLSVNGVRSSNQQQQQMQQNSHSQQHQQQIFPMGFATQMPLASTQGMRGGIVGLSAEQGINGGGNLVQGMVGLQPGPVHVPIGSPATSDKIGKSNGDTSSVSPVPYVFNGGLRGRKNGGAVEKVIERRQRRMIKNRESAARSRARKQAYTMELEAEIAKLKEENQELQKKQEEIMEIQKNQVMEMIDLQREVKRKCLRRTLTGPW